ncbi:Alanine--tRNA ligase [Buchnera aphidicola (Cinara piceae)]|uniref:Alanine--tRNA ligase n=1 Tax=Buchnera aphidicola (Cinara piceae) TaxID=1660043 RepID=A0A803FU46_9GAMM|nr:alanine--tRNA ligase [Buchnera aphidicola]VFP88512.1 Alanine--tRNA ligase [Buchnera aphidicola (Cinara piceae)]
MKTDEIRSLFLQFFNEKKHTIVSSSSLIPKNDDSLLFTNAGMNQFKNIYLGYKKKNQSSFTSSQYCIRTGGKHDDFKKVGYEPYHHTLFEMLGNFSFGEYFKEKAIIYAWEFLTDKKWLQLSKKKIWVTYYYEDYETKNIWLNIINLPSDHLIAIYDKNDMKYNSDNFWRMGDLGPCGPCTEIFYNTRKKNTNIQIIKNSHELKKNCLEIWNLVFMQFNQITIDKMIKLPIPSVDTGMGLERISAILQNVSSSYQTDNFITLIQLIKEKLKIKKKNNVSLKIISDHIRTSSCLISENIIPGNEGRSYVLRRIIRRALSHGYFLDLKKPFFYKLSKFIIYSFKKINSDFNIYNQIHNIKNVLFTEEKQFHLILKNGMNKLKKEIKKQKNNKLCEKKIFYLYDTFGLPLEITQDICREKKITINIAKLNKIFYSNKKKQKKNKKTKKNSYLMFITKKSIFDGYNEYIKKTKVIQIIYKNQIVSCLKNKYIGILVLEITPFYGESSGQIGDSGEIISDNGIFIVEKTKKNGNFIAHIGFIKTGFIKIKDIVQAKVNIKKRKKIQSNHTSTHLLHFALNKIFKSKINQKGSLINDKYLRFDFQYNKDITEKNINNLEIIVNKKIQKNIPINAIITSLKKAKKNNVIYLPSKKYKKTVRIIDIKDISTELCSGTHHDNTGQIGFFKIISYKKTGHQTKRIKAITGIKVIKYFHKKTKKEKKIENLFTNNKNNIYQSIKKIINNFNDIKKENTKLINQNILQISANLISTAYFFKKIFFIIKTVSYQKHKIIRKISDIVKEKLKKVIIILLNKNATIITFLINITKNIIKKICTLKIMKIIFSILPGQGGGKKNIVEGKLTNKKIHSHQIKEIKIKIIKYIKKQIK